jgi:hypothetical protein
MVVHLRRDDCEDLNSPARFGQYRLRLSEHVIVPEREDALGLRKIARHSQAIVAPDCQTCIPCRGAAACG